MKNQILRDDIEYIVHCEEDGKIIGPISKVHAHFKEVRQLFAHYSTWSMVYNGTTKKYGLQLKNPSKHDKHTANKWDMGVAGHNSYVLKNGEYEPLGFAENLMKEASEEIGIDLKMYESRDEFLTEMKNTKDQPIGYIFDKFAHKDLVNNEFVGMGFVVTNDSRVSFVDDEVIDFQWLSPDELNDFILNNSKKCCNALSIAFERAESFRTDLKIR